MAAFLVAISLSMLVTAPYIHDKSKVEYTQMEQLVLTRTNKINVVTTMAGGAGRCWAGP